MKNILLAILLLPILLLCTETKGGEKAADTRKQLCLQLYSLRDDIKTDYDASIKATGEIGFTSIEAADYEDGKFYGKTPTEFKQDLEKVGLTALSSHATKLLSASELKNKDFAEGLKWRNICLDASKEAGMKYVVAPWMEKPSTLADLQTYCEYYDEIGKLAKEKELQFGYHNHAFEFEKIEGKVMYDYMLENTNPEYVFFQMDVYWTVRGGSSPVDYFHKYPNRFTLLHIKDNKELGQSGMVGFDSILKEENTKKAGVEHLIVEVEDYNFTPKESVKMSYDYLQSLEQVAASFTK